MSLTPLQPSPRDLTTVADVLDYLDMTLPSDTDKAQALSNLVQRLVTAASVFIQTHLNRDLGTISRFTETRNGNGNQIMSFGDYPVSGVIAVSVDGQDVPQSNGPVDSGWTFSDTALYLRGGYRFVRGVRNVLFTYDAGYQSVPEDVAQVTVALCSRWYKDRTRIGVSSKGMGGEQIVFTKTDLTDEFKSLLRQYQKTLPV